MKKKLCFLAAVFAISLVAFSAWAGELVNVAGASGIALDGYDPVAFFTDHKPMNGDPAIKSSYKGATYFFSSKEHKAKFDADPEMYVPQFGGYCAYGAALGSLFPIDIKTWQVKENKLYLNLNPAIAKEFNKDFKGNIAKADKNWPGLMDRFGDKQPS